MFLRLLLVLSFAFAHDVLIAQISFFNMPNPDMLAHPGAAYIEYDRYQTLKGSESVNTSVVRFSYQTTKFLEVGVNTWFNSDHPGDPNRAVIARNGKPFCTIRVVSPLQCRPVIGAAFTLQKTLQRNISFTTSLALHTRKAQKLIPV